MILAVTMVLAPSQGLARVKACMIRIIVWRDMMVLLQLKYTCVVLRILNRGGLCTTEDYIGYRVERFLLSEARRNEISHIIRQRISRSSSLLVDGAALAHPEAAIN
jgi:hypothetical protein